MHKWAPEKNLETTIKCFIEEFKDEDVGLVVKTNIAKNCLMDRNMCLANLRNMINQVSPGERKCKVYLIHGHMSDEEMHALYLDEKIHAMVAIPHGEGFGLPIFEAAYSGLPVISVGWSGQCDFLYDRALPPQPHFYQVFDINTVPDAAVWNGVILKESGWSYARPHSVKQQMRNCYNDITNNTEGTIAAKSCERALQLKQDFSTENMYQEFVNCVVDLEDQQAKQEQVEDPT